MDWRKVATTTLVSSLAILALLASPLAAEPRECEALQQWAIDHQAELPTDYAGLLAYPLKERRAIYGILSAEQKVTFWQDRVAAYLAAHPELSASQVDAIVVAASALRPEIYGWQKTASADPLAEVAKEALAALGGKIVGELFYGLGPADPTTKGEVAGPGVSSLGGTCDCRNLGDCEPPNNACAIIVEDPCTPTTTGCGFFGNQACIRNCVLLP